LALSSSTHDLQVENKADDTPVTIIDQQADAFICEALSRLPMTFPVVSEEGEHHHDIGDSPYWLVDPLDGTKGFIAGSKEYTVNIALVVKGLPVLGVIVAPALKQSYWAADGVGAWFREDHRAPQAIQVAPQSGRWRVVISHFHDPQQLLTSLSPVMLCDVVQMNSSLKFCLIAKGEADAYIRTGPTSHWDSAAGQCVLHQAGGATVDFSSKTLHYTPGLSLLNPAFVALGDRQQLSTLMAHIHTITGESR